MADLGLPIFDRTIQDTNHWLAQIGEEVDGDRQEAYHALRAVLFALRDRVPTDLAAALGAQLPVLIRGIYYEGYDPSSTPLTYRTLDEWEDEVEAAYLHPKGGDPEAMTTAVFRLLRDNLSEGLVEKIFTALPEDVRELWPRVEEEVAHND